MIRPKDLGLPAHFTRYRSNQLEVARILANSDKRFRLLSAPPGNGKSLINMTVAQLRADYGRTLILTGTKNLQAQMVADFGQCLEEVSGMANYRCVAADRHLKAYTRSGANCSEGPCRVGIMCEYKKQGGCLYYDAQARAAQAMIVITNYAYWLAVGRNPDTAGSLGAFDTVILDEAHTAPDWLTTFCTVKLDKDETMLLLGLSLPPINEGVGVWSEWALHASQIAGAKATEARALLGNPSVTPEEKKRIVRRILRLTDLERGLGEVSGASRWRRSEGTRQDTRMPGRETDWAVEPFETRTERGVQWRPVWPHAYAEQYLYRSIPNVILTSGTMTRAIMKYLGIPTTKSVYVEMDTAFDAKRHPTYIWPIVRVDRNNGEGEKRMLVNAIDKIIASREGRKGLIHCQSFDRMKDILRLSKFKDKMISHGPGTVSAAVTKFKAAKSDCVLVSPSAKEGVDLPYDDCRYVIIIKVPFLDGRSELVKARSKTDPNYVNYEAAQVMVQMAGRGMRAKDDSCEVFILDAHMTWFGDRAAWPAWFRRTWKTINKLPDPLRLEET